MPPSIVDRETAHAGYLTVERLRLRLDDGPDIVREVEHHGESAVVLPYDPIRRTVLLARQLRAPVFDTTGEPLLEEACAGMIETGDAEASARREAMEELGVRLRALHFVGRVWPSPGVSTERQSLFLAEYAATDRVGPGGGLADEQEDVIVVERPLAELAQEADRGQIADGKLLTLVLALRLHAPDLFR